MSASHWHCLLWEYVFFIEQMNFDTDLVKNFIYCTIIYKFNHNNLMKIRENSKRNKILWNSSCDFEKPFQMQSFHSERIEVAASAIWHLMPTYSRENENIPIDTKTMRSRVYIIFFVCQVWQVNFTYMEKACCHAKTRALVCLYVSDLHAKHINWTDSETNLFRKLHFFAVNFLK